MQSSKYNVLNTNLNPTDFKSVLQNYTNQHWTSSVTKQGNVVHVQASCYIDDDLSIGEYTIGTLPYDVLFPMNFCVSLMDSSNSIIAGKCDSDGNIILIVNGATLDANIIFCMNFHYVTT